MQKKCPFRKIINVTDYHWEGNNPLPGTYMEDFDFCLGKECMAWKEEPINEHIPDVWTDEYIPSVRNYCELTKEH